MHAAERHLCVPLVEFSGIAQSRNLSKVAWVAGEGSAGQPGDIQEEEPSGVQAQEEQVLSDHETLEGQPRIRQVLDT